MTPSSAECKRERRAYEYGTRGSMRIDTNIDISVSGGEEEESDIRQQRIRKPGIK